MLTRVKVPWVVLALGGLLLGCDETSGPSSDADGGTSSAGQAGMSAQAGSWGGNPASGGLAGSGGGAEATQAGSAGDGQGGRGGGSAAGDGGAGTGGAAGAGGGAAGALAYPPPSETIEVLTRVNEQFANKWPDPATPLPGSRPSNIWTRGVYFEGLMALNEVSPHSAYLDYALDWAKYHDWSLRAPSTNADNQCAGQTYFDLFVLGGASDSKRIAAAQQSVDDLVKSASNSHWTWIDAIQMSMPLFAQLGAHTGNATYFSRMYMLYSHTKKSEGGGLYDARAHLWWRDAKWKPPQLTPSGKNVYWSRGNGWVFAALVRVLERLPPSDIHRAEYERDFIDMAAALRAVQREDGLWNPSLGDATHFGGPEVSGTSLFTYGMAWGIRRGLLTEAEYGPIVRKAWSGMLKISVRADGFLGFAQSTGDDPSDGQPLSADKQPDFEDYGVGCFLLAGSELVKLSDGSSSQ